MESKTPSVTSNIANVPPSVPRRFPRNIPWAKIPTGIIFFATFETLSELAIFGDSAIRTLYVVKELEVDSDRAITILHTLSMISDFLTLFGAIITDTWLGKYKSISKFMKLYITGHIILTLSSIRPMHMNPRLLYLVVSAIITSIANMFVAPSLASFGGDQFIEGQDNQRSTYYSVSYLMFNILALMASFLFPMLRDIHCLRGQFCYPLAFGTVTSILVLSTVILFCGRPFYRIVPPSGTVTKNFVICVWVAVRERFRDRTKREHWLDRADIRFSPEFINTVKAIFGLLVLFLPLPVYDCLYEQVNTSWTIQSDLLNGRVMDGFEVLPDSMIFLNSALSIFLIPIFDFVIYPLFAKFGLLTRPLQRMCTGGFFVALSFVCCGILNIQIEKEYPFPPSSGNADLMMINSIECSMEIYFQNIKYSLNNYEFIVLNEIPIANNSFTVVPSSHCPITSEETFSLDLKSSTVYSIVFDVRPDANITMIYTEQRRERHQRGNTVVRFIYLDDLPYPDSFLLAKSTFGNAILHLTNGFSNYLDVVKFTNYDLCWAHSVPLKGNKSKAFCYGSKPIASIKLYKGAIVDALLFYDNNTQTASLKMMFAYPEDRILIWYQFPQYLFLTIGEVMLEITAMSFNYYEAPDTLKAVVTAMWIFTGSVGHLLVVVVVQLKILLGITKESVAFFCFAAVMAVDMTIFSFLSYRYKYKTHIMAES